MLKGHCGYYQTTHCRGMYIHSFQSNQLTCLRWLQALPDEWAKDVLQVCWLELRDDEAKIWHYGMLALWDWNQVNRVGDIPVLRLQSKLVSNDIEVTEIVQTYHIQPQQFVGCLRHGELRSYQEWQHSEDLGMGSASVPNQLPLANSIHLNRLATC